jgi:acetolactate synthase-1/2/3 large subunit
VQTLRDLAEKANIPVTTTLQGMGAFDEMHPLSMHMLGMHGAAYANYAIQNADLIIAAGARFDDRVTGNLQKFAPAALAAEKAGRGGIIHFEVSPKNVNKVVVATEAVVGDVGENLAKVLPRMEYSERKEWIDQCASWKEEFPFSYGEPKDENVLRPQVVVEELHRQTKDRSEDVVVTTGVGCHQMWAAQFYRWRHPRSFITSGGSGTMGYGVPAAIGAKLAMPDKIVVDIDGDASYSMTCQEMLTAAEYNVGVKILILNNNFQGMVKQWQDLFYDARYSGTPMFNPDFAKLADAMGCTGIKCETPDQLEGCMEEFLNCEGPVVMDVTVEKAEHVYPMVPAGAALDEMVLGPPGKAK